MALSPTLLELAQRAVASNSEKQAFVPAGAGDPAMGGMPPMPGGGAPPMDPAMAGGMPPMDPAMGGMPPMDPAMAGGMPPMPADAGAVLSGQPPAQPATGGGGKGSNKLDAVLVYTVLGRIQRLLTNLYEQTGLSIPPDTLDDQAMATAATGEAPQMKQAEAQIDESTAESNVTAVDLSEPVTESNPVSRLAARARALSSQSSATPDV